jgi:hypothetical protein
MGRSVDATAQRQAHPIPPEARTTTAQKAWIQRHVTPQQRGELQAIARSIARDGALTAATEPRWQRLVMQLQQERIPIDVYALVQWTMREAYVDQIGALQDYADKVEYFNEDKKKVRDELAQLRRQKATTASRPEHRSAPLSAETPRLGSPRTQHDADARIAALDAQLQTLSNDAQLANVAFQSILQKQQQQRIQMFSNLSKALHDSAMAAIRKIGG